MQLDAIAGHVQQILGALQFPAHKNDITSEAEKQGAPEEVMQALEQLPAQKFGNMQEVMSKLPQLEGFGGLGNEFGL